jgi:hypothetical protein
MLLLFDWQIAALSLTFRDRTSGTIAGDATAEEVKAVLEATWTIGSVNVAFLAPATEACAVGGSAFTVCMRGDASGCMGGVCVCGW